jgi:epoxyqueuosine reductase
MHLHAEDIKEAAYQLGFSLVGITPAVPSPTLAAYEDWIAQGMHGAMGYLARPDRVARRRDLNVILPGAQSLIVVGVDYGAGHTAFDETTLADSSRGRFARYAWGLDYHDLLGARLEELAEGLARQLPLQPAQRVYVDTGAILERSHAQEAGLGFIGKNTMLIHPRRGGSFFVGEIITTLAVDSYDEPQIPNRCGTCQCCLTACPTDALVRPFTLDARLCISYHTIENKGWIDPALRPQMGNWVFGCDLCLDACPFERFGGGAAWGELATDAIARAAPPLQDLLALDERAFAKRYTGTPIFRTGRARLLRNACVAAGNWGDPTLVPALRALLAESDPALRGHAAWALARIGGRSALTALRRLRDQEADPLVQEELARLLEA